MLKSIVNIGISKYISIYFILCCKISNQNAVSVACLDSLHFVIAGLNEMIECGELKDGNRAQFHFGSPIQLHAFYPYGARGQHYAAHLLFQCGEEGGCFIKQPWKLGAAAEWVSCIVVF